jgi:PAS domain-containing protein
MSHCKTGSWQAIVDLSKSKQQETALRESEELLRTAMSAANMGAWEWDAETNRTSWDENFRNLIGSNLVESGDSPDRVLHNRKPATTRDGGFQGEEGHEGSRP